MGMPRNTDRVQQIKTHPRMSIREVIKVMEKYNKIHKTHYTYGQFVALMEGGKIYVE